MAEKKVVKEVVKEVEVKKLTLYQKLLELQRELSVLKKDKKGDGYMYTTGTQLLHVARPKMDELGLLLLQEMVDTQLEHVLWSTAKGQKQQTFAQCKFKFTWVDAESGQKLEQLFDASGFNSWDKAIGSAMTYAERYFFLKTFHIPTDDLDPDNRKIDNDDFFDTKPVYKKPNTNVPVEPSKASSTQLKRIYATVAEKKIDPAEMKAFIKNKFALDSSKDLTPEQATETIKWLENQKDKAQEVAEAFGGEVIK